jgi:hypothetical protein
MAENVLQPTELPQTLMWAQYPDGRYGAVVQADGRAVYFAVQKLDQGHAADEPSRWVWVRNLRAAPLMFADSASSSDRLPMVPEGYCRDAAGGPPLDLESTRIWWFEQGLGAVLVEADRVVALIPPQPLADVPGYSAQCQRACAVALPLDDDDLYEREAAGLRAYWQRWSSGNPAENWRDALKPVLEQGLGPCRQELTTAAGRWPPLGILHLVGAQRQVLITVGVALRCQPMVERDLLNYRDHQRFELGLELPHDYPVDQVPAAADWLAGLARYPWFHETCFLPTHTVATTPPGSLESAARGRVEITSEVTRGPEIGRSPLVLPRLFDQPVNLWWLR